jgi:hypothetical protein
LNKHRVELNSRLLHAFQGNFLKLRWNFGTLYVTFSKIAMEKLIFLKLRWTAQLIHANAVVRLYGRKGESQRLITPQPFKSLTEAWPLIRSIIKTRLRHGYRVIQPQEYRDGR